MTIGAHGSDPVSILARALREPALRLRSGQPPSAELSVRDVLALIDMASRHRILLLLGWTLRAAGTLEDWPAELVESFQRAERAAISVDCVRQAELAAVLGACAASGVAALVFKGAALAQTHYPAPHVRPRADTDLLVPEDHLPALEDVLRRLGYLRPAETSGRLVSYQSHYQRADRHGITHALDVHWKISNFQALADRFTHAELWALRVPLPALGPSAVTVDAVHALLLALIHRAGHHPGSRNLLWIYDLQLLAAGLNDDRRRQFEAIAAARGLGEIVAEGLALTDRTFGDGTRPSKVEALAYRERRTQLDVLRCDLEALPDWQTRRRLLREHLLPPAGYMRARYGVESNILLPPLYLWRVLHGVPKWLRRQNRDT
ncbi:MAG TPA: nucleotidyltransferase family protein [Vicinamibacterales bacterium]|jgi:hypothetical protein|nr:nucleotidyltransferase family protein [Vicinamibacterales bacterium]